MSLDKTIFIVSSWVPFPVSEYGGVMVVIADNEAEVIELLGGVARDYEKEEFPNYMECIEAQVAKALRFPTSSPVSEVVYQFMT